MKFEQMCPSVWSILYKKVRTYPEKSLDIFTTQEVLQKQQVKVTATDLDIDLLQATQQMLNSWGKTRYNIGCLFTHNMYSDRLH